MSIANLFQTSVDKDYGNCNTEEAVVANITASIVLHLVYCVAFSPANMLNRPITIHYPYQENALLLKKPKTMMKRFGGLVTGSYKLGGSQSNFHKICLKQLMPAIGSVLSMPSISRTFLDQLIAIYRFLLYKQPSIN